ncbi:glycosyltransferase, partial [Bifidobacterium adolescentis]|uniref:glycosyltransferase n=1 Tax=Bifidobacterium adolescentis TaxID=1680 RepID=UPI00210CBE9A
VCFVISVFAKAIKFPESPMYKRYAVLISARNEAYVIGNLIDCLHSQTYPSERIDIWLVADNCTDNTAEVARNMGSHVIERFNKEQVGKGY